jgi:hypothetical protein
MRCLHGEVKVLDFERDKSVSEHTLSAGTQFDLYYKYL